jgi:hypothetical protein
MMHELHSEEYYKNPASSQATMALIYDPWYFKRLRSEELWLKDSSDKLFTNPISRIARKKMD